MQRPCDHLLMSTSVLVAKKDSVSRHIARTNLLFFFSFAVQALRGFVLIPLFLKFIGVIEYGRWVLVMSWTSYAFVIVLLALDTSVFQYVTPHVATPRGRSIYWTIVRVFFMWLLSLLALAVAGSLLFVSGRYQLIVIFCILYAAGQAIWTIFLSPFRCVERTSVYFFINSLITFGDLCVTVMILYFTRNVTDILGALAIYNISVGAALCVVQLRHFPPASPLREAVRPGVEFGGSMMLTRLITTGFYVLDKSIVTVFSGLSAVAAYAPPMSMAQMLTPLNASGAITLPTLLVKHEVRDSENLKRQILMSALKQWCLLAFPATVGIALVARPVLEIIATHSIAVIGAPIAGIASLAILADGISNFAQTVLRAEGDIKSTTLMKTAHFFAFLVVAIALSSVMPKNACYIVALSLLAVNFSYAAWCLVRLHKYIHHAISLRELMSPLSGTAAMLAVAAAAPRINSILSLIGFIIVCAICYAIVIARLEHVTLRGLRNLLIG